MFYVLTISSHWTNNLRKFVTVEKVEALKHYKFSLAFENTNEEDYVTEKFFQSLVAGIDISHPLSLMILQILVFASLEELAFVIFSATS